jgi:hypothetical protein
MSDDTNEDLPGELELSPVPIGDNEDSRMSFQGIDVSIENREVRVVLHEKLLEAAIAHAPRFVDPLEHQLEHKLNRTGSRMMLKEMHDDIVISKQICEKMEREQTIENGMRSAAEQILDQAIARQSVDAWQQYVNVTNQQKYEAVDRVLRYQQQNPKWNIVAVDVADALKDVKPITETYIDDLRPIMHVHKHIDTDDMPDEIMFAVPSRDIPNEAPTVDMQELPNDLLGFVPENDFTFEISRYVMLDPMPDELKRVIRAYLVLQRGAEYSPAELRSYAVRRKQSVQRFADAVKALNDKVQEVAAKINAEKDE